MNSETRGEQIKSFSTIIIIVTIKDKKSLIIFESRTQFMLRDVWGRGEVREEVGTSKR